MSKIPVREREFGGGGERERERDRQTARQTDREAFIFRALSVLASLAYLFRYQPDCPLCLPQSPS